MVYELRIYHAMPGRLPDLVARFANHTLALFERHGIQQSGFWTTLVGPSNQQLTYLLRWESLAEREAKWGAFLVDPDWLAVAAASEQNGPILREASSAVLAPTAFSALR